MITRILAWWRKPLLAEIALISEKTVTRALRDRLEAMQKDLTALRNQAEAVKGMKRAIDMLITENQKYRDRVKEAGREWNEICRVLNLPVPCTFKSALKLLAERNTNNAR